MDNEINHLWSVLVAMGVLMAGAIGGMFRMIMNSRSNESEERSRIYQRIESVTRDANTAQVDGAVQYATKSDIARLDARFDHIDSSLVAIFSRMK